jgi:hypothetical protein
MFARFDPWAKEPSSIEVYKENKAWFDHLDKIDRVDYDDEDDDDDDEDDEDGEDGGSRMYGVVKE